MCEDICTRLVNILREFQGVWYMGMGGTQGKGLEVRLGSRQRPVIKSLATPGSLDFILKPWELSFREQGRHEI